MCDMFIVNATAERNLKRLYIKGSRLILEASNNNADRHNNKVSDNRGHTLATPFFTSTVHYIPVMHSSIEDTRLDKSLF